LSHFWDELETIREMVQRKRDAQSRHAIISHTTRLRTIIE